MESISAGGGNSLLLRFIESSHFSLFHCVSYLERYANNVGIHWYLCNKLRSYPADEIEFFLPQLVQLHVTVETESMALEDLLLDLCQDSTHCTLLVFWQLQAHLTQLAEDPSSYGFQVCKRIYNKIQYLLFNVGEPPSGKLRENSLPALVLASMVAGAPGAPTLVPYIKPMAVSQGRKQRSHIFHIASKLIKTSSTPNLKLTRKSAENANIDVSRQAIASLPDLTRTDSDSPEPAESILLSTSRLSLSESVDTPEARSPKVAPQKLPTSAIKDRDEKIKALKTNYFRCETQFMYALHSISTRLTTVPKQARLSALRAELALLNRDLPAEVDIPLLLPRSSNEFETGQNQIVRISPAEATVLNSAEKVPFLLLIEYLKNEVDFNPDNPKNQNLLTADRRYIFDMTYLHKHAPEIIPAEEEDFGESDMGDLSALNIYDTSDASSTVREKDKNRVTSSLKAFADDNVFGGASGAASPALSAVFQNSNSATFVNGSPRPSDLSFSSNYFSLEADTDINEVASHMRTAAVMLNQLDSAASGLHNSQEVSQIKAKIVASMQSMEDHTVYHINRATMQKQPEIDEKAGERRTENDMKIASSTSDDPSAANLGEDWNARKERIRRTSPFGHLPNWDLFSVIAKTGDDLRQEAFACQLIQAMTKIWADTGVGVWVKKMSILITDNSYGLVETITNGLSIHSIKKALTNESIRAGKNPKGTIASLSDHFASKFPDKDEHDAALQCFVKSLATYSLICYLLQIKDRHNGNILLDNHGHIIHIDFGFLLTNTPGRFGFEAAPFKLTQEYVDLMGGTESALFLQFRTLLKDAFKAIRKQADSIIILVDMMSRDSDLPCFQGDNASLLLRQRFQLHLSDTEADQFVDNVLIRSSYGSMYTRLYDQYQLLTQGIYS